MIISNFKDSFQVTHIPMFIETNGEHMELKGHVAIANEHWKIADGKKVLAIFNGPHYYISPKWYVAKEAVPTWNYMTVHIEGLLSVLNFDETVSILKKTLEYYEIDSNLQNSMDQPYYSKMAHGVKGFRIVVSKIYAKYKLSQNRTPEDRVSIIKNLQDIKTEESLRMAEEIKRNNSA